MKSINKKISEVMSYLGSKNTEAQIEARRKNMLKAQKLRWKNKTKKDLQNK